MKEYNLICPHCGTPFEIDEKGYMAIAKQVRDKEYNEDLKRQRLAMEAEKAAAVNLANANAELTRKELEHKKDTKIQELENSLKAAKSEVENSVRIATGEAEQKYISMISEKDSEIAKLTE